MKRLAIFLLIFSFSLTGMENEPPGNLSSRVFIQTVSERCASNNNSRLQIEGNKEYLELSAQEPNLKKTFAQLLIEKKQKGLPYIFALVKRKLKGQIEYHDIYDGINTYNATDHCHCARCNCINAPKVKFHQMTLRPFDIEYYTLNDLSDSSASYLTCDYSMQREGWHDAPFKLQNGEELNFTLRYQLAKFCLYKKQPNKALEYLSSITIPNPSLTYLFITPYAHRSYALYGRILRKQKNFTQAEQILLICPTNMGAELELGLLYEEQNNSTKAKEYFSRAINHWVTRVDEEYLEKKAINKLVSVFEKEENYIQALETYKKHPHPSPKTIEYFELKIQLQKKLT